MPTEEVRGMSPLPTAAFIAKVEGEDFQYKVMLPDGHGCNFYTRTGGLNALDYLLEKYNSMSQSLYDRLKEAIMKLPIPSTEVFILPPSKTLH